MARGSMRQTGTAPEKWQLRAYAGMDSSTGKEKWLSKTVTGPRRQAEGELAALVVRAARMRDGGGTVSAKRAGSGKLTVREAFEAWRESAAARLEPNGADTDADILRSYIYPHLGDVGLWQLRPKQLAAPGDPDWDPDIVSLTAYYHMLAQRGTAGRRRADGTISGAGQPLGGAAIRRAHGVIRRALAYCLARGWVSHNAAVGAELPPMQRRAATIPESADLAAFVDFLLTDDPEVLAFVSLMGSGARRVDMGVQWGDVTFGAEGGAAVTFGARGLISQRNPDGKGYTTLVRTTPTRKRKLRTVALDQAAAGALLALRARAEADAALCRLRLEPSWYVFSAGPDGTIPRPPSWFTGAFRNAKRRAAKAGVTGLSAVRPYDVRHHMITQLLAYGMPAAVVAERAGNSMRTMDAWYRHAVPAQDQAAADLMARIMRDART